MKADMFCFGAISDSAFPEIFVDPFFSAVGFRPEDPPSIMCLDTV